MTIFSIYSRRAPNRVFAAIVLGALAGIAYALLIPLVLSVLRPGDPRFATVGGPPRTVLGFEVANYPLAVLFATVCVGVLVFRSLSQILLARVAMDVATGLRIDMYRRIVQAPLLEVERIGSAKLVAALTTDVPRIVAGARMFPDLLTNMVSLLGMLSFLLFLNAHVFRFVLGAIAFGVVSYQIPKWIGRRFIERARAHVDVLQESIRGLIHGIKELKLDPAKRADYFQHYLIDEERALVEADKVGQTILRSAGNFGNLLLFFVVGAVAFVLVNYQALAGGELVGIVMVLLYVTGPVSLLLNAIPQLAVAQASLKRVGALFKQLPSEPFAEDAAQRPVWRTMSLRDVTFSYRHAGPEREFTLGPLSLDIYKGEVTFIVGGNGSGKSTLAKMITLHYPASSGRIAFDGEGLTDANVTAYRRQIASIYSDYYLFRRLLGVTGEHVQATVEEYLRAFGLAQRVSFRGNEFSTVDLSDGQKRRLALVVASVENKQLYLFDEWAADQDPTFKEAFYRRILPDLKARGKAVVVITHDDRYFGLADRLVVMDGGRIARVETRGAVAEELEPARAALASAGRRRNDG